MGIILSSFKGCGREYLKNTHGDKIKIFDAIEEIVNTDAECEEYVNKVMDVVDENDIVFIDSSSLIREAFNKSGIDYDLFYPSKERRGEFIENQVRKRTNPKDIRDMDKNFEKWIEEIENDEASNCYKHKLSNQGDFIGNSPIIMQYIDGLKQQRTENNEQKQN